ncbi:hypothetical protein B4119_1452 [Parageobacillus caldoxylosilyticus]|uniref:Uncharacterized protein n=1 Tax=Saccharococcus caldoxylosilyticus TaxID=81408 RepID=A0A150LPW2_9BACL|nr:hypothetical protein B4119_1452 [Parageobacillus caldoxylosilyticus]
MDKFVASINNLLFAFENINNIPNLSACHVSLGKLFALR